MPKKKSTALAAPKSQALSAGANLPAYMKGSSSKGKDNFNSKDLKLPFLRLAQGTSPSVKKGKVKEGQWYNTLTGKVYGPEVEIVPVVYQAKQMRFEDYKKGGGILCQAPDGLTALEANGKTENGKATKSCPDCKFSKWGEEVKGKKQPPECDEQGAYVVLVPGEASPMVLILAKTSFPAHRQLATMINQSQADIYGNKFKLSSIEKDEYRVIQIEAAGWADEVTFKKAEGLFDGMVKTFTSASINKDQVAG